MGCQQKGCQVKHLPPSMAPAPLQTGMGALGSLTVAFPHPEGLCGGAADPLDQSRTSHQALACFWRCPCWVSSGRNLCALELLCSAAQQTDTTRLLPNHPRLQTGTLAWTGLMHNPREIKLLSFTLNSLVILRGKSCRGFIT